MTPNQGTLCWSTLSILCTEAWGCYLKRWKYIIWECGSGYQFIICDSFFAVKSASHTSGIVLSTSLTIWPSLGPLKRLQRPSKVTYFNGFYIFSKICLTLNMINKLQGSFNHMASRKRLESRLNNWISSFVGARSLPYCFVGGICIGDHDTLLRSAAPPPFAPPPFAPCSDRRYCLPSTSYWFPSVGLHWHHKKIRSSKVQWLEITSSKVLGQQGEKFWSLY